MWAPRAGRQAVPHDDAPRLEAPRRPRPPRRTRRDGRPGPRRAGGPRLDRRDALHGGGLVALAPADRTPARLHDLTTATPPARGTGGWRQGQLRECSWPFAVAGVQGLAAIREATPAARGTGGRRQG